MTDWTQSAFNTRDHRIFNEMLNVALEHFWCNEEDLSQSCAPERTANLLAGRNQIPRYFQRAIYEA